MNTKTPSAPLYTAFLTAYHTVAESDTIYSDPMARSLVTDGEYDAFVEQLADGTLPFTNDILARLAYAEDAITLALRTGAEQILLLGAGFSTLALRQKHMKFFEADRPAVLLEKRRRMEKAGLSLPKNAIPVPCLTPESLDASLQKAGFLKKKKTFFLWLGGSYSMTEEETESLLVTLSALGGDGSTLLFDYKEAVLPSADPRLEEKLFYMSGGKEAKTDYTYAELEALLEQHGFLVYERLTPDEIGERYFRKGEAPLPISYVQAVIKKVF